MKYRCVATSVIGFVQQLVSCYLPNGYWFYVSSIIPPGKDPTVTDEKLIAKYGIGVSRTSRARRKAVGVANVHCKNDPEIDNLCIARCFEYRMRLRNETNLWLNI